jgi:hypothetical protein
MAIVPRAQNLVELRPVTDAKFRPADPGNNFGETLQRAGQALSQYADEQDRLHATYDEAAVKALDNAGVDGARDLLDNGDQAYSKQQGLDALSARKPTEDAIKALHAEMLGKTANPRQRRMLEAVLQQREQDYSAAIAQHADQEVGKEDARQSDVRTKNFFNDAANAADDANLFAAQLTGGLHEIEAQGAKRGEAPIVTDDAKKTFVSDLHTTVVQQKLLSDVDGADAYYRQNRDEIDLGTQFQLDQLLKVPLDQRKASARVDRLMGVPTVPAGPDAVGQTRSSEQMFMRGIVPAQDPASPGASLGADAGPEAARLAGLPYDAARLRTDAAYGVALGKSYFAKQLADFGSPDLAAAAFHLSSAQVHDAMAKGGDKWLSLLPAETQAYVAAFQTRNEASQYSPQPHDPNELHQRADVVEAREHWTVAEKQEVHSEIERRVAHDDRFLSQQQAQAYSEATQQILTLGAGFRAVAQLGPAFATLSPEQQQAVSEVASRNSTGRPVQTQAETLWSLRQKEATDPRAFAALDPLTSAGQLSPDDLRQLVADQSRSIGSDGKISPEAVRRSRLSRIAREAVEAGGIDEGNEGPAKALAFLDLLQAHADAWTAENPGKSPADADLRRWAGSILIADRGDKPISEMDDAEISETMSPSERQDKREMLAYAESRLNDVAENEQVAGDNGLIGRLADTENISSPNSSIADAMNEAIKIWRDAQRKPLNSHGYIPDPLDENLLARMIFAEGGNIPEDFDAVGWSIVNRVGKREFGMTLHDVLLKRNQFQIVEEGGGPKGNSPQWNLSAKPDKLTGPNLSAWKHALSTAHGILNGTTADPTGGATHFFVSDSYDGTPKTAEGDFPSMLKRGTLTPAPYRSRATGKEKQYFFLEVPLKQRPKPKPRPKRRHSK